MHGSGLWELEDRSTPDRGRLPRRSSSTCCRTPTPRPSCPRTGCTAPTTGSPTTPRAARRSSASSPSGTGSPPGCSRRAATSGTPCAPPGAARATRPGRSTLALDAGGRARPRPGAADLRRGQPALRSDDRAQRRRLRGHPQRQAALLGADAAGELTVGAAPRPRPPALVRPPPSRPPEAGRLGRIRLPGRLDVFVPDQRPARRRVTSAAVWSGPLARRRAGGSRRNRKNRRRLGSPTVQQR